MFSLSGGLFKAKASIFAGTQKLISMNDRRLVRKVGNPVRQFPYHGAHVWNYRKKYMILDHQNPDPNTTTAEYTIFYNPSKDSEPARAAERAMLRFLPGCKVSLEPSKGDFEIFRKADRRLIVSTNPHPDPADLDPIISLRTAKDLVLDLSKLQQLIAFARS